MKKHKKFLPYVRRANGRERTVSPREAIRLAYYQSLGRSFYVMVQRGFPNDVIGVGASKRDVQKQVAMVAFSRMSFRRWAKTIQKIAYEVRSTKREGD